MEKELPKGWVETDIDTVTSRITNGSSLKQEEESNEGTYPISRIETIWNETIDLTRVKYVTPSQQEIEKFKILKGDVLFSHINSDKHLGKTAVFNLDEVVIHGINLLLLRTVHQFDGYYFNYLLRHYRYSGLFIEAAQRSVNQSSINQKKLKTFKVPLPPLAEQQRIVAKLDTLFGHLENVKSRLENIPTLLKNFRQAVLTQAVTGKLTEQWREGKELEEWEEKSSSEIFDFITSGSRGWAQYYSPMGKQLFVRITNMSYSSYHLNLEHEKLQFLELPNSSEGKRTLLKERDVLISITADIGMIALIPKDFKYEAYVNQHVCLARPNKTINEMYLVNFLMSKKGFGQLEQKKRGATKVGLTLGDIKNLKIDTPPLPEQTEIVRRVESLFAKADAIEAQYNSLKQKIDNLPQALLAKAFKGELVEQLPTDGDAKALLAEIQKLKY